MITLPFVRPRSHRGATSRRRGPRRRRPHADPLQFESLESRMMLSVGAATERLPLLDAPAMGPSAEVAGLADDSRFVAETHSSAFARFSSADELAQYLIDDALERYAGLFGKPAYPPDWRYPPPVIFNGIDLAVVDSFDGVSMEANGDHSETNTQVAGVDEADLVETDDNYIYLLSGRELVIVDAWPAEELRVASRVDIGDEPFALYLSGDRLTVLSRPIRPSLPLFQPLQPDLAVGGLLYPWPTSPLQVTVLDVSDREAPTLVQRTELDGSYVDSRAVGDLVYIVLANGFFLPGPEVVPASDGTGDSGGGGQVETQANVIVPPPNGDYVYETREQYLERMDGQVLELVLPKFSSFDVGGEQIASGRLDDATEIYRPGSSDDATLHSIVVFDAASDTAGPASSTSAPARYGPKVYASADSLYLLSLDWSSTDAETSIRKFDLNGASGSVELSAMGSVPGVVLNQFSVDQYAGHLRIATTQGRAGRWGGQDDSRNNLYVLQQQGESLEIVGRLEDLAPGESIYSARFLGDRAFLVTYRKVDPLFAVDLSSPTDPHVEGELKIPGFSNYLHAIDDTYLIGIGRNADENTGLFQDPQVSLFNVGQLASPELVDRFTIETGRTGGMNVFYDHHVVAYFPEHQVLTVSVPDRYEESGWDWRWPTSSQNNLWVFKVDLAPETGGRNIELLGEIEQDTSVRRSVRIGEVLYSVSEDTITAHELLNPESALAELVYPIDQLGEVQFTEMEVLKLSAGDHWYGFETSRDGILTIDATFHSRPGNDAQLTLYDSCYAELATSVDTFPWSPQRIDWQTEAGTHYYLKVSGTALRADVRLANLLEIRGQGPSTTAYVYGSFGEDTFEVETYWATVGGDWWTGDAHAEVMTLRHALVINGIRYDYDARIVPRVSFDGGFSVRHARFDSGSSSDRAVVNLGGWSNGTTVATLSLGSAVIAGSGLYGPDFDCSIELANVGSITVRGGNGADTHGSDHQGNVAHLYGSLFGDTFVATPRYGGMSGLGFSNCVLGFDSVFAYAEPVNALQHDLVFLPAGPITDVAKFYDSPGDDTYVTTPSYAGLCGDGFQRHAVGFDQAHAYATAGGSDRARMYDSPADDTFYANPIQGSLYGQGFFNRAKFFEQVHAFATAGGHDAARLFGSAGDDSFYCDPVQAALWGDGFYNRGKHFEQIDARATGGGNDQACLHDSSQSDHLEANGHSAQLTSVDLSFACRIADFDRVRAVSGTGGDTKRIAAVDFALTLDGQWTDE